MPPVTIWQHFLLTSSYLVWELRLPHSSCWAQHGADPIQGHGWHQVLCQYTDPTQPHHWVQEQHISPSSRGAPFWGPGLMHCRQGEGAEACPCLPLVMEKRCWSVSVVAMGIGWQALGAGVSNSLETASLHSYCKLQETSEKTTHRAPAPCTVFETTQSICFWSHCFLPVPYNTLQCTGHLFLTQCCFSVSLRA